MSDAKKTPLYDLHHQNDGKIVDFGGWALPVQFSGIIDEVNLTRSNAGLFDVSHMGELMVEGQGARDFLQKMVPGNVNKLKDGKILYTPMCYEDGGTIDDFLIYRINEHKFLLVVNANNTEKDYEWLKSHITGDVEVNNLSDEYGQIAIQGPKAESILQLLTNTTLSKIKFFNFASEVDFGGITALVSRTGYTGEDGFEIYLSWDDTKELWEKLEHIGGNEGLIPVGLGARDVLRFEVCLPLYGQELSQNITPIEAGLKKFVQFKDGEDFIGKDKLLEQYNNGVDKILAGFEMIDKGIPRTDYELFKDGEEIGVVSSGSHSPTLGKALGLGFIKPKLNEVGTEIEVKIRKRTAKAKVIKLPFYRRD